MNKKLKIGLIVTAVVAITVAITIFSPGILFSKLKDAKEPENKTAEIIKNVKETFTKNKVPGFKLYVYGIEEEGENLLDEYKLSIEARDVDKSFEDRYIFVSAYIGTGEDQKDLSGLLANGVLSLGEDEKPVNEDMVEGTLFDYNVDELIGYLPFFELNKDQLTAISTFNDKEDFYEIGFASIEDENYKNQVLRFLDFLYEEYDESKIENMNTYYTVSKNSEEVNLQTSFDYEGKVVTFTFALSLEEGLWFHD